MKLKELLREDWGSSDWHPIMKALKKALEDGTSLKDAAQDEASRYYKEMGYDDEEDAADRIIYMFKLRNPNIKTEARTETKGAWKIQNLSGVMKNFKDAESPEARAWMKNRGGDQGSKWNKEAGRWEGSTREREEERTATRRAKERDKEEREARNWGLQVKKPKKASATELEQIYRKVDDAIGNSFPDGDPIDHFQSWLLRNNFTMDDVDRAFKKHHKMGYYKYLETFWDEFARDQIADAKAELKRGGKPQDSSFYDIEDDKVVPTHNPWKSS